MLIASPFSARKGLSMLTFVGTDETLNLIGSMYERSSTMVPLQVTALRKERSKCETRREVRLGPNGWQMSGGPRRSGQRTYEKMNEMR